MLASKHTSAVGHDVAAGGTVLVDVGIFEQNAVLGAEVKNAASIAVDAIAKNTAVAKAVAGADGYDVYCGSSKTSQKGTVVKGTTKLTANKTKLTSGKTYYFRARAYKMVGSAKVYTGYSAVKSVKVK